MSKAKNQEKMRVKKKKSSEKSRKSVKKPLDTDLSFHVKEKNRPLGGWGGFLRLDMLCKLNLHKLNRSSLMITLRMLK